MFDPTWKYTNNAGKQVWPRLYSPAHHGAPKTWGAAGYDGAYFVGVAKNTTMQQMADEQGKESYDFVQKSIEHFEDYAANGRPVAVLVEGLAEAGYNKQRQLEWLAQSRYVASLGA